MKLLTISEPFVEELEEKKSRFIAHLVPYAEFETTLTALRAEHPKASHHVTAFRYIDDNNQIHEGAKDDGEPAGTSGMPVLKSLIGAKLINIGIIVVRYFGGTKLGTGGLARAYSGAAQATITKANLVTWQRVTQQTISARFEDSSMIEQMLADLKLTVLERSYDETGLNLLIEGPEQQIEVLNTQLSARNW